MGMNTSISLGEHFEGFILSQIETGRYGNRSEVVRSALRDMEERKHRVEALRQALIEGEQSGPYTPFDMEEIIASARRRADQPHPRTSDALSSCLPSQGEAHHRRR